MGETECSGTDFGPVGVHSALFPKSAPLCGEAITYLVTHRLLTVCQNHLKNNQVYLIFQFTQYACYIFSVISGHLLLH